MKSAQFVVAAVLGLGILQAVSQTPAIDSALKAKADAGDPAAEVSVGESYAKAAGAASDPETAADGWNKAAEWYAKAAAQSYVPAEIHLADCYSYGRGVTRDKGKAAEWYRKAADHDDARAQGTLAMLYTMGQGVPQDDAEAYFWFDLAASADTPNKERYLINRQNVGTRITADQLAAVQQRLKKWKAAHPHADAVK
ncbi:tetratricopeptide repeat protein [Occallatibacter riparius]|uniref:Sel1 repeat family protein n=1 Tax=Occallatibacter riparius TaxID=1002689 RepID=A0A9J7BRE6_9BACT|nr:tetratricopeptide repeat protein [Occallatibacter riparius]UWZ85452.1 sel1 repeat family protein [Occallatibacter riparius]